MAAKPKEVLEALEWLMRKIAVGLSKRGLALKGGAALVFGHGINRTSKDLDFDGKNLPALENAIRLILKDPSKPKGLEIVGIETKKHTDQVTRCRVGFMAAGVTEHLKVEVSHRRSIDPSKVIEVDGIRVFAIDALMDQKLDTIAGEKPRVAFRDLRDLEWLVVNHPDQVTYRRLEWIESIVKDPDSVIRLFNVAADDTPEDVGDKDAEALVLSLILQTEMIRKRLDASAVDKALSGNQEESDPSLPIKKKP